MTSALMPSFRNEFRKLPERIRRAAEGQYQFWRRDPFHPSLQFKEVRPGVWSVRVTGSYRALGLRGRDRPDRIEWIWIGPHAEYDRLLRSR